MTMDNYGSTSRLVVLVKAASTRPIQLHLFRLIRSLHGVWLVFLWSSVIATLFGSNANWEGCEMTESDLQLAPWTLDIRHVSETGIVAHYPALILDHYTLITRFSRVFIAPGPPTWRRCRTPDYSVHLPDSIGGQELKVRHVSVYPDLIWFGRTSPNDNNYWVTSKDVMVLIHLESPLVFSETVRPICLPNMTEGIHNIAQRSHGLGFMTGWPSSEEPNTALSLDIVFAPDAICKQLWRLITEDVPYDGLACGYNTANGTATNPDMRCIRRASGIFVRDGNKTVIIGFLLNYFSNKVKGDCDELTHLFVSTLNERTVGWIERGMKCGAQGRHACNNRTCITLDQVCDGRTDCSDGEDEDEKLCGRPVNCCVPQLSWSKLEFACGKYGECIRSSNVSGMGVANCNGIKNCPNGEDEDEETCLKPTSLAQEANPNDMRVIIGIGSTLGLLLTISVLVIVVIFRQQRAAQVLNQEIIDDFFEGSTGGGDDSDENELLDIRRLKYNPAYEFEDGDCVLGKQLGRGRFGTVYAATINGKPVAVKTQHQKDVDVSTFIALLAELKMMLFIEVQGGHPNIVRFIGAHTKNIRACKLHLAMEFCDRGDLEAWLQENRSSFGICRGRSLEQFSGFINLETTNTFQVFTMVDLVKWSMQIAQAMSFLQSKRIVHSDLAIRNVLLDDGWNAKICDFGLSHQLTSSSNVYTTTTRLDFPWRGAAPEVLDSRGRNYNLKSDVWSFGVTIWEIFSLSQVPWSELENEDALLAKIQSGHLILPRPQHYNCASDEIYEIMCSCWKLDPEARPSFQILTLQLQSIYDTMCTTIEVNVPELEPEVEGECQYREHVVRPELDEELPGQEGDAPSSAPAELNGAAHVQPHPRLPNQDGQEIVQNTPELGRNYISFSTLKISNLEHIT